MDLITNYNFICAAAGWISAQILKFIIGTIRYKRFNISLIVSSGGMPSSHSAMVCALAASLIRTVGAGSPVFAVSVALAVITMYDAANVRRYSGEHARLLNIIIDDMINGKEIRPKELKELIGHTPLQVIAGACLGIFIPLVYRG